MDLISIDDLTDAQVATILDEGDRWLAFNRQPRRNDHRLDGLTILNAFFENSTRTLLSFEIAAQRLGAQMVTMQVEHSSIKKGETLEDTARTLNAMRPDALVIRHGTSGAPRTLAGIMDCPVINAGDGTGEHPTQALLDAATIRRHFGKVDGLKVAICGDLAHSRVARSNVAMLSVLGAEVRLVGPPTLIPAGAEHWGVEIHHDMKTGLKGVDVVMMLRLQLERMQGALVPSTREYFRFYGLDRERLSYAASGAKVMHPGPMNRGVEIDSDVADDPAVSLIQNQVEMGVAARMAVLASLAHRLDNAA